MRNFRNLKIWQDGIQLVVKIYKISESLPKEEKFGLKSQICRAAVSIPSNIAEGASRKSELDYRRFLEISLGSAYELETQLEIIKELKMIGEEDFLNLTDLLNKEQKSIHSLMNKLN